MSTGERIKVGFVGYGRMAEGHARNLGATGLFEPVAVCDVTATRRDAATAAGLRATDDLGQFLQDDSELVFVTTNSVSHHAMTMAALKAGKNVVVEKPMAMNAH